MYDDEDMGSIRFIEGVEELTGMTRKACMRI